jgi:hypothetical protein
MPALVLLASALGLNYARHRRGLSTICSTCRRYVGPRLFLVLWVALTGWLAPHYLRGFARAAVAVAEAIDDIHAEIEEIR